MSTTDVSQMKSYVGGWREVLVMLHSVVTWEQDWYPAVTAGCLTSFYLFIYSMDPSSLTLLSLLGLVVTLLDYLTPLITSKVFPADSWSPEKEKKLESFCRTVLLTTCFIRNCCSTFNEAKSSKPALHFAGTVALLLSTAYLGSLVSGMMLSYITLMVLLMLPGLHR